MLYINKYATNAHERSNENVICLSTKGSFKGDLHNCMGNEHCSEEDASSKLTSGEIHCTPMITTKLLIILSYDYYMIVTYFPSRRTGITRYRVACTELISPLPPSLAW
ncbi:hypothetical protein pdam_00012431 [Pocillopora damicornis]|uniref:Uncharacterized protein n=1 Tax=Pocillopora damicornis TaxID=46731 RepID=A0A3M6TBG6_POCDA|nr:hypothetical protein pdam_00012431 [Pocillopora damicornis]